MDDREYRRRRIFFVAYVENVLARRNPTVMSAITALERFERQSRTKAVKALELGIADCVLDAEDISPTLVAEIDDGLRERGAVTLSELRDARSERLQAILRKGGIRTDDDYAYVKNLVDSGCGHVRSSRLEKLRRLMDSYEASRRVE